MPKKIMTPLRRLMFESGMMTQKQLAKAAGVGSWSVFAACNGLGCSDEDLSKIASVFNLTKEDLRVQNDTGGGSTGGIGKRGRTR